MADFTSKIKGAVDKATSAAKEMAQETTDMKDKPDQNPSQEDSSSYGMAQDQMEGDGQYANVSEFNMSPMSQDSQKLSGSMEQERMGSGASARMYDDRSQAEMDSSVKDQVHDGRAQADTGSSMKGQVYDSRAQTEMGRSTLPASQCMPESGSAAKQS